MPTNNPSKQEQELFTPVKIIWKPIAGIIGAIILINTFFQTWTEHEDQMKLITIILIFGIIIILLGWAGFTDTASSKYPFIKKNKFWARVTLLLAIGTGLTTHNEEYKRQLDQFETREAKTIILLTSFDGPEEKYGIGKLVYEQLISEHLNDDIEIIKIDEAITPFQGSEYAKKLGLKHQADIVIWAWYQPTENPNLTIHVENLSPATLDIIGNSVTYKPISNIADLESFTLQQKLGTEITGLIIFLAGYLEYEAGNYEIAEDYFQRALSTDWIINLVSDIDILFNTATNYLRLGKYKNAIVIYDRIISLDPRLALAHYNRGLCYANIGEYEMAISSYNDSINLDLINENVYRNRGDAYVNIKQLDRAIADYDLAIELNSKDSYAYYNRGLAFMQINEYNNAIKDFSKVIDITPSAAKAYFHRGRAYASQELYRHALADFNKAIELEPQNPRFYNNRGKLYTNIGIFKSAFANYNYALDLSIADAEKAVIHNNRGLTYFRNNQYNKAITEYDLAISSNPQLAYIYFNRGLAYQARKYHQEAISDFSHVIEKEIRLKEAYYHRGFSYQSLGENEWAISDFNQVLSLCGNNQELCNMAQISIFEILIEP